MKSPGAKKQFNINPKHVEKMASFGCTQGEIAGVYGCSENLISTSYSQPYNKGREHMKVRLRKKQLQVALRGSYAMLIWLGKQMLGQREPPHEVVGKGGEALVPSTITVVSETAKKLTEDIQSGKGTE